MRNFFLPIAVRICIPFPIAAIAMIPITTLAVIPVVIAVISASGAACRNRFSIFIQWQNDYLPVWIFAHALGANAVNLCNLCMNNPPFIRVHWL